MAQELRQAGLDPDWKRVDTESDYLAHLRPELDVILADYRLPGFDAFRALDLLKGCALDIPFIIVSGAIGEDTAVAAIKQGAADYLLKDRLARLGPAVVQAMDHKRLREEKRRVDEEARLEAQLLDAATDSIFVHDLDGKVVYVNEAADRKSVV